MATSIVRLAVAAGAGAVIASLASCDNREPKPKIAGVLGIGSAYAQQADLVVSPEAITGAMAPVDEAFARFAASSNVAQIEAARLVLKATRSEDVGGYAQRIMRDHAHGLEQLSRIVKAHGLKLAPTATGRHADMVTKLSGVSARDLNEAFLQRFGRDAHKETISLYERHIAEGRNDALKRYAEAALPLLREHLAAANKLLHAASAAR
jgi:putative membrane protein